MFEDGKRFDQLHIEATREINPHQGTMDFPVHESKTAVTFIGDVCASTIETRIHISHPPIHPRSCPASHPTGTRFFNICGGICEIALCLMCRPYEFHKACNAKVRQSTFVFIWSNVRLILIFPATQLPVGVVESWSAGYLRCAGK